MNHKTPSCSKRTETTKISTLKQRLSYLESQLEICTRTITDVQRKLATLQSSMESHQRDFRTLWREKELTRMLGRSTAVESSSTSGSGSTAESATTCSDRRSTRGGTDTFGICTAGSDEFRECTPRSSQPCPLPSGRRETCPYKRALRR